MRDAAPLPARRRRGLAAASFDATTGLLGGLALLLLVAPTLVVVIVSFTSGLSLRFPPPGYSFRWYVALLEADQLLFAFGNSLRVAIATTLLSVVLGVAASLAIARSTSRFARALDAFGLAALIFFTAIGLPISILTLVIGHTVVCVPYVIRTTTAALAQLDGALLDSSASLGASGLTTFRRVTLPLIRPGVLSGAFVCFMASFDNVPVSLFLRDAATDMLPIRMWQNLEGSLDVTIAAASTVLIVLTVLAAIVAERVAGLSKRL
jgi:putative spermidine/putrescine transport system permease protein